MIFGTDGIRAPFGEEPLTCSTIMKLSKVIWEDLGKKGSIVLGTDTRVSCQVLLEWITSQWKGLDVHFLGVVPTPVVAYETWARQVDLGVMMTASHNPYQDNGLKFFSTDGSKIPMERAMSFSSAVESMEDLGAISERKFDLNNLIKVKPDHYQKFIGDHFGPCSLNVVWDLANGAGCPWVERWIENLFPHSYVIGNEPNGENINHQSGALWPSTLGEEVRQRGADLGFALDGDGDRLVVVDSEGKVVHGDRLLFGLSQMNSEDNLVVSTIMAGLGLEEALAEHGKSLHRTDVGDQHVLRAMLKLGARTGGETSGHYISADLFPAGDGFLNALKVSEQVQKDPAFLKNLDSMVPVYPQFEKAYRVHSKPPIETLESVSEAKAKLARDLGNHGRCILRYSGTEKKIRLFVEALGLEKAMQAIQDLEKAIREELQ